MIKKTPAIIECLHYTAATRQAYRQLQQKGVNIKYIPPAWQLGPIMKKAGFKMISSHYKKAIIHWWINLPNDQRIKLKPRKRKKN